MYKKECKWCHKEIEVEKQCLFALHVSNCDENPNKKIRIEKQKILYAKLKVARRKISFSCPKCSKEFEVKVTDKEYKKGRYKKFCSRECANSHQVTDELKQKISTSCKNSEKVKIANSLKKKDEKDKIRNTSPKQYLYEFTCQHCGQKGFNRKKNTKYHAECWKKISGGIRKGSSRGKCGWYKGIWCDSSYELAYVIYCLEHDINIGRNTKGYNYSYENEEHLYFPDFRANDKLVEIKNFRSELTDMKLKAVDEEVTIYYKDTIIPFLDYAKTKYGNDFIKLYNNEKD